MTVTEQQQMKDPQPNLEIRILSLNIWGIPGISSNRKDRIEAIAQQLLSTHEAYNYVFLQEVWSKDDYKFIAEKVSKVLPYSHYFYSGVIGSGLCTFSCTPILEVHFHPWSINGFPHKILHGDWFGGKGVALAMTKLQGVPLVLVNVHFHAEYNSVVDEYIHHRVVQAFETSQLLRFSQAEHQILIFGGDLNCGQESVPYRLLTYNTGLTDSYQDCPIKPCDGVGATNETPHNSYTSVQALRSNPNGNRIDHILFRGSADYSVKSLLHDQPFPPRICQKEFSFSDHEAVRALLSVKPRQSRESTLNTPDVCFSRTDSLLDASSVCLEGLRSIRKWQYNYSYLVAFFSILMIILLCVINLCDSVSRIFVVILLLFLGIITCYNLNMAVIFSNMEKNAVTATKNGLDKLMEEVRLKNARLFEEQKKKSLLSNEI